ncbi:MAG: sigma-70 family RNA polymerase sigma factor [Tepidisphaeraceae bacterium]|jgi:RNA polymerase sigma-70 factor (ECF subfamily)
MERSRNSIVSMAVLPRCGENVGVPDDVELMQRAGRGDQAAFRELVERHGRYLLGIAVALSRNAADAEDLVQETFLGALGSTFRGESSVRTWLVRILVNRAAMLRRSKWRMVLSWPSRPDAEEPASMSPAPASDAKLDLAQMLQVLSPEHREVIVLRELEGMTYEEIASELGIPRGTVESRLHRAREQMRERFKGYLE